MSATETKTARKTATKAAKATTKKTTRKKAATKARPARKSSPLTPAFGSAMTKAEFARAARQLQLKIASGTKGTAELVLDPREFSSGSFGWFASEKLEVPVGQKKVRCQLSLNVTVIGSKKKR